MNQPIICVLTVFVLCNHCIAQQSLDQRIKRFNYQLKKRVVKDQKSRKLLVKHREDAADGKSDEAFVKKEKELLSKASKVDEENLKWLKEQIKENGIPNFQALGTKSADYFFLLILHADRAPGFQFECREKLKSEDYGWPESYPRLLTRRLQLTNPKLLRELESKNIAGQKNSDE